MKTIFILILGFFLPLFSSPEESSALANQAFTTSFLDQLKERKSSFLFSPYGLHHTLFLIYLGADGSTKTEMQEALFFSEETELGFSSLRKYFPFFASSIWVDAHLPLLPSYRQKVGESCFFSSLNLDEIHTWIQRQTNGKISSLIPPSAISSDTKMVAVQAGCLTALWEDPFSVQETYEEPFFVEETFFSIPMMHKTSYLSYLSTEEGQFIKLPLLSLEKEPLDLYIFLPKEGSHTIPFPLHSLPFSLQKVDLSLPSFTLSYKEELSSLVKNLGLHTSFSLDADFSQIEPSRSLCLDRIFQGNTFSLNEEGISAATATAGTMRCISSFGPPLHLSFNRPFYFFLLSRTNPVILFMGYFYHPEHHAS